MLRQAARQVLNFQAVSAPIGSGSRRRVLPHAIAAGLLVMVAASVAAQPDPVSRARLLYNERQYDAAIEAAVQARKIPAIADAAALVLARAYLERYRQTADAADLVAAREGLRAIRPEALAPRDRVDYLVGLGEALFLDDEFGAAAEVFGSAVEPARETEPQIKDQVLDWWASALDRQAYAGAAEDRSWIYDRILERMVDELRADPASGVAAYWIAAAARGAGDLDRAWSAAVAGWVRAPLTRDRGAALRADLDRLMLQAIIPERAREEADGAERERATASMRAEWESIKRKWAQ